MVLYNSARIKNGKLEVDKKVFIRKVSNLSDGDYILMLFKRINGTVREMQKLYFALIGEWENDTGWSKEDLHELIKQELFPELFNVTSTQDLTLDEWTILINELQDFLILKFENK